jgi:thioredoxin 2
MAPVFEAAAAQFEPAVRFGKLDTDAEPELATRYHIQAIPTMILLRDGREIARYSAAMPGSALRSWIEQRLAGQN